MVAGTCIAHRIGLESSPLGMHLAMAFSQRTAIALSLSLSISSAAAEQPQSKKQWVQ